MALTLTPSTILPTDVWGETRQCWVSAVPAASDYATGGYTLTPGSGLSLGTIDYVIPIGGQGGVVPVWNTTTSKLQMFGAGTDAGVPLGLGTSSAASTVSAVVSHVGTVTVANSLTAGNFVLLTGFTRLGALNGTIVQVASATSTQFTFNLGSAAAVTSGADTTGHFQVVQAGAGNLLTTSTTATITNSLATTSLLTMTCSNSFSPGNFVVIQGLTNGAAANGVIVQILTASSTQFTATWTGSSFSTAADSGTAALLVTAGGAPITIGRAATITNSLATASSAGTAGVITLTAANNWVPGNIVVIDGLTNGAAVNGDILTVISTSLTNALFVANGQTAAITTGADAGVASLLVTGSVSATPSTALVEMQTGTDLSSYTFQLLVFGN